MRIDIHPLNVSLSDAQRGYAQRQLWMATRHIRQRVAWLGLWLCDCSVAPKPVRIQCRVDAWVSGAGIVTVKQSGFDLFSAIDVAAARLKQAIDQKIRQHASGDAAGDEGLQGFDLAEEHATGESAESEAVSWM